MATAWESLKELGIEVPEWKPDPENRDAARDEYRKALQRMQKLYLEKTRDLRYPPEPGPRPMQYEGAPPFPPAQVYPPEPQRPSQPIGLTRYPSVEEINRYIAEGGPTSNKLPDLATPELRAVVVAAWQTRMKSYEAAIEEYRPQYDVVHAEETRILLEYKAKNDEWLDTVFYPGEAERAIWEIANEALEESRRQIRAEADLARDELDILRAREERRRLEAGEKAEAAKVETEKVEAAKVKKAENS